MFEPNKIKHIYLIQNSDFYHILSSKLIFFFLRVWFTDTGKNCNFNKWSRPVPVHLNTVQGTQNTCYVDRRNYILYNTSQ